MKRKIITDIKILKQKSLPLSQIEIEQLHTVTEKTVTNMFIKDLEDSLDSKRGLGLCAIQIGIPKRIGIVRIKNTNINLINPKIIEKFDKFRFQGEGCLSMPGLHVDTSRYMDITIENGDGRIYSLEGIEAIVVQHEIDHMNGLLMTDRKWRKRK